MHLLSTFSSSVVSRKNAIIFTICILTLSGTVTELLGGIWDATSHLMQESERFWAIQHIVVYTGVSIITGSAILGGAILVINFKNKTLIYAIKIIIIGSVLQLTAGYADSVSHEIYGLDGLAKPSHLILEVGLLLSTFGGFMACKVNRQRTTKIMPVAIMTVILSAMWLGFSFALLFAAVILCIPVYELFSSGCAVF